MPADRFIPFRKQDIINMCVSEFNNSSASTQSFKELCHLLSSLIHFNYHERLEALKNDYAPFDPNADTQQLTPLTSAQRNDSRAAFANNFTQILNAANYEKITEQDLQEALTEESLFKVRLAVEFDDFEQVVFFRRGESQRSETLTSFFGLRKKRINFTNYDRVAVFITFKNAAHFESKHKTPLGFDAGSTIIKLFQNVPKADLEMLFPNSEVRMRPIDKVIIGGSAVIGGATVLITKLGASLLLLSTLFLFWLGIREEPVEITQQHFITLALGTGIFGGFIFKEWTKFKNRKIKFMKALADNLYFKNLNNNAGVFHTLIDSAEEEDFKEAILAYTFLLTTSNGLTSQTLDKKIEEWFKQQHNCIIDFEISDALHKLELMNLVSISNEKYYAVALEHAKERLDSHWDNIFNFHQNN